VFCWIEAVTNCAVSSELRNTASPVSPFSGCLKCRWIREHDYFPESHISSYCDQCVCHRFVLWCILIRVTACSSCKLCSCNLGRKKFPSHTSRLLSKDCLTCSLRLFVADQYVGKSEYFFLASSRSVFISVLLCCILVWNILC